MKNIFIRLSLVLTGFAMILGMIPGSQAWAGRTDHVPALRINNIGNDKGHYLSVFYAMGARPFLALDQDHISIRRMRVSREVQINGDSALMPPVDIDKSGVRGSYQFIVIVVSDQKGFTWVNDDGTIPEGSIVTNNRQKLQFHVVPKKDVDAFLSSGDAQSEMPISL